MRWNKLNTGVPPASVRTPRQRSGGRRGTGALLWFVLIAFALVSATNSEPAASFVHKKKYIMGTVFEIVAYDESPARASDAIDKAFQEIVRLDEVMSNYKPDSALSRLNRSASVHPQSIPPDLYRVIAEALH